MSICPTGKIGHPTWRDAKKAKKRTRGARFKGTTAYLCRACGQWHIGHRKTGRP